MVSVWTNLLFGVKVLIQGGNVPVGPPIENQVLYPVVFGWLWTIPNATVQGVTTIPATAFVWTWFAPGVTVVGTSQEIGIYSDTYSDTY